MDYGNRIATLSFVFLAIIILSSIAAYISYTFGQDKGYSAGYEIGQEDSYNQGLEKGKGEGYQVGYDNGYETGLREGGSGYDLQDPTYKEMIDFIAQDTTDSKKYIEDSYTCTDFSAEVNRNAEAKGIRCAIVYIMYPEAGHTIIAFETKDKGLKFIEPQFDDEVKLIKNKKYSEINNYTPQSVDDTIKRFVIIW